MCRSDVARSGRGIVLAVVLGLVGGCAAPAPVPRNLEGPPPSDEERLQEVLRIADRPPKPWNPIVVVPLAPVILVVDTSVKFVVATVEYLRQLLGAPAEPGPVPEPVERQAEKLPKH